MRHSLTIIILAGSIVNGALVNSPPSPSGCAYENCLWKDDIPNGLQSNARDFCTRHVGAPKPTTKNIATVTTTIRITRSLAALTRTATVTKTAIKYSTTPCYVSGSTVPAATVAFFPSRAPASSKIPRVIDDADNHIIERDSTPYFFTSGCKKDPSPEQIKTACECLLTTPTIVVTPIVTKTETSLAPAKTTTVTSTITKFTTIKTCLSTKTILATAVPSNCGAPKSIWTATTQGQISCAAIPTPSLNALLRIEGNDSEGTIFEGCIKAGPRVITTPSGGAHPCDGTNYGANPNPGTTPTDQLDAASKLNGFPYDGTWSTKYDDFFITSISSSTQTASQFWAILVNGQYTPVGGCQFELNGQDRTLWAYDGFSFGTYLQIDRDWAVVTVSGGTEVVRIIDATSGDPVSGAAIEGNPGELSDTNGNITIHYPRVPGCYKYKATKAGAFRSNTHYISVYDHFARRWDMGSG